MLTLIPESTRTAVLAAALTVATCAQAQAFTLSSPDIHHHRLGTAQVFKGFGCEGDNRSPALQWTAPPAGTQSLAVTVYDPDAPTGSGWWHWQVYNLPADARGLPAGIGETGQGLPDSAVQGRNDYGQRAFGGACPPVGDKPHRYVFTVHALKVPTLDLPAEASAALVGYMLNANSIGKAGFTAVYGRK